MSVAPGRRMTGDSDAARSEATPLDNTRPDVGPAEATARHKFDERPFIAIWEMTQACDLACKHCRASARPGRDTQELSTFEGKQLLSRLAEMRVPFVVLTGGDPAKRPDLLELVQHGVEAGLHLGLTPSATPLVTDPLIRELAGRKLSRLAVSIDGPDAVVHDTFRGVLGSFDEALRILNTARNSGITTQVNTTVHAGNIDQLARTADLVQGLGATLWSVFFVVPTGRAEAKMLPDPEHVERILTELAELAETRSFALKTTAAPHYRRVLVQRRKRLGSAPEHGVLGQRAMRINEGRGFVFISHRGQIFPSGFLPIECGNVRTRDLLDVYCNHPIFQSLRDTNALHGKCGACDYRNICGGSRARSYALTGDYLESDVLCSYIPAGYEGPRPRIHLDVLEG
ncbi:MAG TPA: TIGR04053 family radical SAM/SPASM domain-containing protein [Polyangiaceae bacterium]|nr:TIGR04053 family radical SAM/SPASM domain-containing protein [Polyangiaceae bacterium]